MQVFIPFFIANECNNLLYIPNMYRRITDGLGEVIPNLENLVLTNNHLQELGDLDPLAEFKKLTYLSLLSNPVANKQHYRSYVIHKIPSLRVLDFNKVKESEREAAKLMFKSKKGKELAKQLGQKTKNFAAEGAAKEKIGKRFCI
jgi:U2 small nuclear ribonucleoprotein A'